MRREFASHNSKDVAILSVDDMAKIKVGAPAVSRYHQVRSIFMHNDAPNLSDHDFPVPGYLLNVSGHMFLEEQPLQGDMEALINASVYDRQTNETTATTTDIPSFNDMEIDGPKSTIFLKFYLAKLHLNVKLTAAECEEIINEKIGGIWFIYILL